MKKQGKEHYKNTVLFLLSLFMVAVYTSIFAVTWLLYYNNREIPWGFYRRGNWILFLIYVLLTVVISKVYNAFNIGNMKLADIIYSQILTMLCVNVITYFQISLIARVMLNVFPILVMMAADIIALIFWGWFSSSLIRKLYPPHNVLMVYGSSLVESISEKVKGREDQYKIAKWVNIDIGVDTICKMVPDYEGVIICDVDCQARNDILKCCFDNSVHSYMVPKISDILIRSSEEIHMFDSPLLLSRNTGLTFEQRFFKRMIDLVVTIPAILIASPFMLIIAAAIKIYDGGPVFYKQERETINQKHFYVYKFRSMIVDAEKDGKARLASEKDTRITPVGRVLRKIRMDELPQLFNVLFGHMSLVGPRPERPEIAAEYEKKMPEFRYRTKVKAGLTGYAQVLGKYNTTPYDKLKLDLSYIAKYSTLLDIKLLFMTVKILFISESTEGFADNSIPDANRTVSNRTEEKRLIDDTDTDGEDHV